MKTYRHLILAILVATPTLRAERTQAPIPDFMTPTQLAVWQQERIAKAHTIQVEQAIKVAKASTPSAFYTGKPYLAESGTYSFLARQYNPEMARWTTVDPSGFPDGANNRLYAAAPTIQIDDNGEAIFPISCSFSMSNGGSQSVNNTWNGELVYSFSSQGAVTANSLTATTGFSGSVAGTYTYGGVTNAWTIKFNAVNESCTDTRNDPSGLDDRNVIQWAYSITESDVQSSSSGSQTVNSTLQANTIVGPFYGSWYE